MLMTRNVVVGETGTVLKIETVGGASVGHTTCDGFAIRAVIQLDGGGRVGIIEKEEYETEAFRKLTSGLWELIEGDKVQYVDTVYGGLWQVVESAAKPVASF